MDNIEENVIKLRKERYLFFDNLIKKFGVERAISVINPKDYADPELDKLLGYYEQHKSLIKFFVKQQIKNDV
jgi:hypothetical protein